MVLIIDDDIAVRTSLSLLMKKEGFDSASVGTKEEALAFIHQTLPSLILLDMNFSNETSGQDGLLLLEKIKGFNAGIPVILITGWATIDLAVRGMKMGASDFINKPWQNSHLIQSVRTILNLSEKKNQLLTRKKLDNKYDFSQLIGEDIEFLKILETIGQVAQTDASVLIMGESGTGKELIAEAIHQNSFRNRKPFVKVNLGGISTSLFESEMFGHIRGAFTDARFDRTGRFELANKGTIFLDEIGDLDSSSQVKLLRVLQDRTYEVLGSSKTKSVDVRVVCATNRNLEEMVQRGTFREDLLYRINLITIYLPPLRKRPDDIPLLVNFFVSNLREIYNRPALQVSKEAMKWVKQLPLPGNIRQLKNLVERTVLVSRNDILEADDFRAHWQSASQKSAPKTSLPDVGAMTLEELEVQMIKKAMDFHKGKVVIVAKALGLTRSALYRRLEKYNIPHDQDQD
ncbi:DNA-binding transcriptional response regulator, NtrC family, contains REC, AAA-type ATPase, and a Fis-type DNA-binding domains [Pseudarcicella hirudinis]|uniref:DNA-binding transcriptional response regulator, NtrC family, contains REC, AAA-type ATPase, and a Fis-type DNA-binding domains n=1 Tax=Pseudarcicella hirudinis TaxID=1079859 RepID=A0A1I5U010_9BACT|nr:sigma-54 dependent transcriptional regulator [Pseudarcicella hirudinis]SFP87896.1 DNA-binding transcriptional response regulator, NtrC family, contains REC, AAA-type ATPase, and a Fis-type DNA-binding domains [Pseudarcicella hirudinis]